MKGNKGKKFFNAERKSRLLPVILLSVILPVMVFIVAPFEIYCNNIEELMFSVEQFILIQAVYVLICAAFFFCLLFFIPRAVYRFLYPALIGILLMLFVQTNYLNAGLNSLAGDDMEGTKISTATYIVNTVVWIVVIGAVVTAFQFIKIEKWMRLGALVVTFAITATQLMNFAVISINTPDAYKTSVDRMYGKYEDKPRFLTYKDIDTVASNRNVLLFCVDRMDTVLYADPALERYQSTFERLDGFTYYSDAVSMYGYTFPSVAYMMSAIEYDHSDHVSFFKRVYNENETIQTLHENGYNVHLFSETYYDYANANDLPAYVQNSVETDKDSIKVRVRRKYKFGLNLAKMSLYRSLPFVMKGLVGQVDSDTCNGFIVYESDDLQGEKTYSYDLKNVRDEVKRSEGFTLKGEKNFSFIHVSGCHSAKYDENWKKTKKGDYVVSAKNSIEFIADYLDNMKRVSPDLYRDSTIVIMADHGKVDQRHKEFRKPMLAAMYVKPSGVINTPFRTSEAPVSAVNIWPTIFESEGIAYNTKLGTSVFTVEQEFVTNGTYPERQFIWTRRNVNKTSYDAITYKINGSARDFDNWRKDSVVHVSHPLFAN